MDQSTESDFWSNGKVDNYFMSSPGRNNAANAFPQRFQPQSNSFSREIITGSGNQGYSGFEDARNTSYNFNSLESNSYPVTQTHSFGALNPSSELDNVRDYGDNFYDDGYEPKPWGNSKMELPQPGQFAEKFPERLNYDLGGDPSKRNSFPAQDGFRNPYSNSGLGLDDPGYGKSDRFASGQVSGDYFGGTGNVYSGYPQTNSRHFTPPEDQSLNLNSHNLPYRYPRGNPVAQGPMYAQSMQQSMYSHQMGSEGGHILNAMGRPGMYAPARGLIAPPRPPLNPGAYGRPPGPPQVMINQAQSGPGTGGSNAQGRSINKMLLDILRSRIVDPNRLALVIDANIERMDCVNLATLLFHTGKKRLLLTPLFMKRIATRFSLLKEELRAREASNALYGLKCMSSESPEVRQLLLALAHKVSLSTSDLVAQAVGNAIYGCQMMTSDHEEVRYLLQVLSVKVAKCTEHLEAQNVGNALYGLRGMNSDYKEVRMMISALTPKIASAKEDLNGQALGNSLYGLQSMSAKEPEVRSLLVVLADKANKCWENLKAQEVGNLLYGLKRMNSDIVEVRNLVDALVPKIVASTEILDAQAIGNSFYGMQNMKSDNPSVLSLLRVMADKVLQSVAELDGQAMGNSLYGLQGMKSEFEEVRHVVRSITLKIDSSSLEMNAQELGNALYGLQNMTSDYPEVRALLVALARKVASSKHDLTSQEIGNAIYGLQGMRSDTWETRLLVRQLSIKINRSTTLLDPQGIANSLYGFQRMSSESEEVRMLIQALSLKIEQSWKLLNPQHIANSLYGLQNLSSFEVEVSGLIRALVPKIISCRDDMTSKQISCAFFGLQCMYSPHPDVLALISALTEKVVLSKDIMSGLQLGSALFGLQGFDDSSPEVLKLVAAFAAKTVNNVKDVEPSNLGNCFYGLQRMSTSSSDVSDLIKVLAGLVMSVHARGGEFGPKVCGNILYGLQNCSWTDINVKEVIRVISGHIKDLISITLQSQEFTPMRSSHNTQDLNVGMSYDETLSLYQSLTLAMTCYPNTEVDEALRNELDNHREVLYHLIENKKHVKNSELARSLSIPQIRLSECVRVILFSEPYEVTSGELLFGFETSTVISLKQNINLVSLSGLPWNPVLNIEILGSSHTFPSKDLFTRLRNRYLFQVRGVAVEMIHATMVASGSFGKGINAKKAVIDTLRSQDALLQSLYPPSLDDASLFATILFNSGQTGPQGLMSSFVDVTSEQLLERCRSETSGSNSFFAIGTIDTSPQAFDGFSGVTTYEYIDDNLENDGLGYTRTSVVPEIRSPYRVLNSHWIGDHPKLSSPTSVHSPRNDSNRNSAANSSATTPQSSSTRGSNVFNFASVQPLTMNASQGSLSQQAHTGPSAIGSSLLATSPSFVPSFSTEQLSKSYNNTEDPVNEWGGVTLNMPFKSKQSAVLSESTSTTLSSNMDESLLGSLNSLEKSVRSVIEKEYSVSEEVSVSTRSVTTTSSGGRKVTEEVDEDIALLEAQLEVAKIEAKLLQLKKSKSGSENGSRSSA